MRRWSVVIISLAVLGCSAGIGKGRVDGAAAQPAGADEGPARYSDIAYTGHGTLFRADGSRIELSKEVVEQLQDSLIEGLTTPIDRSTAEYQGSEASVSLAMANLEKWNARAAEALEYFDETLSAYEFQDADERILVKGLAIGKTLDAASEAELSEMRWRAELILDRALPYLRSDILEPRPRLAEFLGQAELRAELERIRERLRPKAGYIDDCRSQGVPIPPDWPQPGWVNRGDLPFAFNFLRSGRDTEVWTYETTEGICYSLPRKDGGDFTVNGFICQSSRTGRACFWDNLDASGRRLTMADVPLRIAQLQNGGNLVETCTDCHRGYNAFVIHPNVPAMNRPGRDPRVRYQPIGRAGFVNPPFAELVPGNNSGACTVCHEIADVAGAVGYCSAVLRNAADKTMPNANAPARWASPSAPYAAHIAVLKARGCP